MSSYYYDVHRTKYMWNVVIADSNDKEHEWVVFSCHETEKEAEAWGKGFVKATEFIEFMNGTNQEKTDDKVIPITQNK